MSFEERFGTQWTVWVGGVALAFGGFFLVRYSIEQGWFGPAMRVFLGGLLALALIAAGEWARRKETLSGIGGVPAAHIPSILTAAGTAVAYADIYAAFALYNFIAPGTAFILLGIVALGTLAAALVHGPALAGLGLVGAYVTPLIISTDKPNFWALYLYLAVVTAAAFMLARARMWRWLAITAIAFGLFWTLPGLALLKRHRHRLARLPRDRRICAGRDLHRVRLPVRSRRRARQGRRGLVGSARGLPVRRVADRADEPARHDRADHLRRAHGRRRRHRVAQRSRDRRGAARRRDGRADVPAILGRLQRRAARAAVRSHGRRGAGAAARVLRNASRARRRPRLAVRRRRLPRPGPLDAAAWCRRCGPPPRCSCRSRSWSRSTIASTSSSRRCRSPASRCCSPRCSRSPPKR